MIHRFKKLIVLSCAAAGIALTLAALLGPFDLKWGLAAAFVIGSAVAAYLVRGVRRVARRAAGNARGLKTVNRGLKGLNGSLATVQQLLRQNDARLEGTVSSLTALASQDRFELIGVLEAQTKAIEAVSDRLSQVEERVARTEASVGETALATELHRLAKTVDHFRDLSIRAVEKSEQTNFAQIEALLELRDLLPTRAPMPPMRGWAASPTTLLRLIQEVLERRPSLVVECGSGVSSLWVGYALEKLGGGRCIALEHDEEFATVTREALARHGLSSIVEVRNAPLQPVDVSGETFQWYAAEALEGVRGAGVVFVDGPPGATGPLARFPAASALGPLPGEEQAVFVLDDADRPEERELQDRWCAEYGATVLAESRVEKGWSVLALSGR